MEKSRLEKTIEYLTENRRVFINICDVAGILKSIPGLYLPWALQINSCSFCNTAKSTQKGLNMCIRQKTESVNKCISSKAPYKRQCYLGITQYICPVVWNGATVCIIYVSNIVEKENIQKNKSLYKSCEKETDVAPEALEAALATTEITDAAEKYREAAEILKAVISETLNASDFRCNVKNSIIAAIINYCNEFYASDITLRGIASSYYINEDYLCRLFKKETGMTFTRYLNGVRIDAAKRLLDTTDKKIAEIAFEAGFASDTYFIRKFSEICGITPKQYQMKK